MSMNKTIGAMLIVSISGPFVASIITDPTKAPPKVDKMALNAAMTVLASSTSSSSTSTMMHTILGHPISIDPAIEQIQRPAFIAPPSSV